MVVIDEFRKEQVSFPLLLKLLDRYYIKVNGKYSLGIPWIPQIVIITCCRPPEQEFFNHVTGQAYEDIGQLTRRLTAVYYFDGTMYPQDQPNVAEQGIANAEALANMQEMYRQLEK